MENKLRTATDIWHEELKKDGSWTDCAVAAINKARKEAIVFAAESCNNFSDKLFILSLLNELQ